MVKRTANKISCYYVYVIMIAKKKQHFSGSINKCIWNTKKKTNLNILSKFDKKKSIQANKKKKTHSNLNESNEILNQKKKKTKMFPIFLTKE